MTIGTVLLLVTVGSLAIFTMVAMAFFHLRFSSTVVNNRSARNIAESALATALVQVWDQNEYGVKRDPADFIHLNSNTDEAAEAFLSFNPDKANEMGVPFSTNNFEGGVAVEEGNGRNVPANAVHLVALGICRGARYKAEVLYYVPPYPNAMASTGPVISTGGLLVAGVPSVEHAEKITDDKGIDPKRLEPGHIVSNSNNGQAIFLGPNSYIKGDVMAVGGITVNPAAEVLGEVRPNASKQSVPDFNVDEVFKKLGGIITRDVIKTGSLPGDTVIDYFSEATSPLVVQGDLVLDTGILYCRNNLIVRGQVRGNGAIMSLGDIKIESGADLTADNQVALVAKGSLELNGTNKNTQFFNGLVYSEKEILAKDITIIGAAVVNGTADSTLELDNVSLVKSPISVTTILGLPKTPPKSIISKPSDDEDDDFFVSTKKKYTFEPPGIETKLQQTLTGGMQMSGMRLEGKNDKGDDTYSILFEGVFSRGMGSLTSLADLTDAEKASLKLTDNPYSFKDGYLFVRYDRLKGATQAEVEARYAQLKTEITAMLPAPIDFQIKEKKKKTTLFIFKSTKTKYTDETLDPGAGLTIDVAQYLKDLKGPNKSEPETAIDFTLNRVIDSSEKSKILLWQQF